MYKLAFFVPEEDLEQVKQALFNAGAGKIGNYDRCCWQVKGVGQFRPLPDSNPHIGVQGVVEQLPEWKVELVCEDVLIGQVVAALKQAHPYEEVAYEVWQLADI
ncbi:Nif3-like dinuclear metal center hexameric protein [Amphritea balenae]|uniref:NGG1p interacting factor NIF3 n=1 Tax=Amphritea balenae TaxID=452629 RepID=A0A3P1SMR6_9GAMM|nr:YqfO family protein [Amphritea balenae]RRC98513.1 NGG1p interacting factor NIF3 [Amphritea balenae]GGK65188.1 NIF3 1 [Amphritea balenae]